MSSSSPEGRYIAVPAYDTAGTINPEAAVVAVALTVIAMQNLPRRRDQD